MNFTLNSFYGSAEWKKFKELYIAQRLLKDGDLIDDITKKPIIERRQAVLHHKIYLTESNVNDLNISLNPDNIQLVSFQTHNEIHKRFGYALKRHIYITDNPSNLNGICDLTVDFDRLHKAIGGEDLTVSNCWNLYNSLLDSIFYGYGKWETALIVAKKGIEFKRIRDRLGAEEI